MEINFRDYFNWSDESNLIEVMSLIYECKDNFEFENPKCNP